MELFAQVFQQKGFSEIKVNVSNISVFISNKADKDYIFVLFHMPNGTEWNKEQCVHVEEQLFEKLQTSRQRELQLITFLCTNHVDFVRDIYRQNDHTAVIDLENNRLLIFEGMTQDDLDIYHEIEKVLQSREQSTSFGENPTNDAAYPTQTKTLISKKEQIKNGLLKVGYANSIIIGLNILVFVILNVTNTYDAVVDAGKLYWMAISENHEYYRIFTCMFLHGGVSHLLNNMLILSCIGGILEKRIGWLRYSIVYLLSGIVAGSVSLIVNMDEAYVGSIGASGAIFGVVGAVLWIVLINKGRVENLSKKQMLLFVIFSLYGGFSNQGVDNAAHIGGLIGGFLLAILIYRKPKKRGVVS
ncbi:MAG: rhomboid family intramembrane serine protease [Clostridiales bacterium]|nr:rhomboid family intramembrane serine protease [Clostridiales bacterium]